MWQKKWIKSLLEILWEIEDFRRAEWRMYKLNIIILMILLWIMSGATSERAISRFIKNNEKDLIKTLRLKNNRVPSRSPIKTAIKNIDFEELSEKFYKRTNQNIDIEEWEWMWIDWKAIRWTVTESQTKMQNFVSLITVFMNDKKIPIASGKIKSKKESEIPKVKELINTLWLKWMVFTIDALHCQKNTVKTIVENENDFVIWVKWNQAKLNESVKKKLKKENQ